MLTMVAEGFFVWLKRHGSEVGNMSVSLSFFFFFQAEDGIRDLYVTGVQTCALPILAWCAWAWCLRRLRRRRTIRRDRSRWWCLSHRAAASTRWRGSLPASSSSGSRSEERRVGKECRSRLASYD